MLFADFTSPERLADLLSQHHDVAYMVLFLGAFFETLIPFSLVVLGEIFFLSGAVLAGLGVLDVWMVMAVLCSGGILGDNVSYWMGRYYGNSLFERLSCLPLIGRLVRAGSYSRGVAFFRRYGALAVFSARLSGPLSWITPAMAGVFHLRYATFLCFNTLGVLVGIGEFIIIGYFFGDHLDAILQWLDQYGISIAATVLLALAVFVWYRFMPRRAN